MRGVHVVHGPERDRLDRRPREAPAGAPQHRPACLGVDEQRAHGVAERHAGGARVRRGAGDRDEVRDFRCELREERHVDPDVGDGVHDGRGVASAFVANISPPRFGVRTGEVQLDGDELGGRRREQRHAPRGSRRPCAPTGTR